MAGLSLLAIKTTFAQGPPLRLQSVSPFVWLEMPDGTRNAIGGRDDFAKWATAEFSGNKRICALATTSEPSVWDACCVDISKMGNATNNASMEAPQSETLTH